MGSLASVYERSGKPKEAELRYEKVWKAESRLLGEDNPTTLRAMKCASP